MKNGKIIPPLSIVRLVHANAATPEWKKQIGRYFRIGYYARREGTGCVWLVNESGEYEQTVEQEALGTYFEVVLRSRERSFFGTGRPPIDPIARTQPLNGRGKTVKAGDRHAVA